VTNVTENEGVLSIVPNEDRPSAAATRGERWAPRAAAALIALPTLVLRFPPMTDLPMHEAIVGMMRHFYDTRYFPSGLYEWNIGHPNQMFHLAAALLSFVVGTTWACKIVVACAQAGVILAAARLADHLGVSRWTALLVSPLALGWTYLWGMVANILGFGVFLAALPTIDRATERPSLRGALAICGWLVLLYFAHESVMVIAAGVIALFTLGQPISRKNAGDVALRIAPVAFALVLFVGQQIVQRRLVDPTAVVSTSVQQSSVVENLVNIASTLTGTADDVINVGLGILVVSAIGAFAFGRWKTRDRARLTSVRATIHTYRFELAAFACALAYMFTPYAVAGGTMLNHRYYHPAYALFALTLAPQLIRRAPSRLERVLCAAVPIGFLFVMFPDLVAAHQCFGEIEALAPKIALGSSVAYIEADPSPNRHGWAPTPGAAHVLALRGGRLMFSFTYSVIAPVQLVRAYNWPESTNRLLEETTAFMPTHDLHLFRYLLVHSEYPMLLKVTEDVLPEARLIETVGSWSLYESKLPLVPLKSPDMPLEDPRPETLRQRTIGRLKQLGDALPN
jgi:hypothetical protein